MDDFTRTELKQLNRELAGAIRSGKQHAAIASAERLCTFVQRHLGGDHPAMATCQITLGDLHYKVGDYPAAESHYRQALRVLESARGARDPSLIAILNRLSKLAYLAGNDGDALALHRRALKIRRSLVATDASGKSPGPTPTATRGIGHSHSAKTDDSLAGTLPVITGEAGASASSPDSPRAVGAIKRLFAGIFGGKSATDSQDHAQHEVVKCGVFAPESLRAGETFLVQVAMFRPEQEARAAERARSYDSAGSQRAVRSLQPEVPRGAVLGMELIMRGFEIDEPMQSLTWRGEPDSVQFGVTVPQGHPDSTVIGTVIVMMNGVPAGNVKFKLHVASASGKAGHRRFAQVGDEARRFTSAFISYASEDRVEVLKRVQVLRLSGIECHQDLLDLEPGDRWENKLYELIDRCDVFLLFWSSAAKRSEWVEREWRYALERKGKDEMNPPEILPVIVEQPTPLPAPGELAHLHFDDPLAHLILSEAAARN